MKYLIQFQYKGQHDLRPKDSVLNDEQIYEEEGKNVPIPDVGDSVTLTSEGKRGAYKVLTRHFSYHSDYCYVNIVVTDIQEDELKARLQE